MKFFLKFPLVYFVKYCKQGSAENNAKLFPHSGFPHLQDKREGNFLSKIHCIYPIFIHMYPDTLVLHKIYPDFSPSSILWKKNMILLPNVFKFLVLDIRIDRSIRMTATTKYPLNSRSCWRRHTSVFLCCLITRNLAGIYTQSALKIEKKTSKGFEQ